MLEYSRLAQRLHKRGVGVIFFYGPHEMQGPVSKSSVATWRTGWLALEAA